MALINPPSERVGGRHRGFRMSRSERSRHRPSQTVKRLTVSGAFVVLLAAIVVDTKFLDADEAAGVNAPAFSAETYADEAFPQIAQAIADNATDLAEVVAAVGADPASAGAEYGTDVGGTFVYQVSAAGTVDEVDADFVSLTVAELPAGSVVRIPLGAALNGTPIRDATGTISFGDFAGQTDYQSVANEFKLKMQSDVLGALDLPSLAGQQIVLVGAWVPGGPPGSFLVQPVSIEEA